MKKISCYLFTLALIAQACFAETVYKGTDANGNTIYSDKPFPSGKAVELAPITTYTPPKVNTNLDLPPVQTHIAKNYTISVVTPKNEETFTTDIVTIEVKMLINPALSPDDRIQVFLNNEPYGSLTSATSVQLDHLDRGAYQVKAAIVSKDDPKKPIAQSDTVTFYQQRNAVKHNVNSN